MKRRLGSAGIIGTMLAVVVPELAITTAAVVLTPTVASAQVGRVHRATRRRTAVVVHTHDQQQAAAQQQQQQQQQQPEQQSAVPEAPGDPLNSILPPAWSFSVDAEVFYCVARTASLPARSPPIAARRADRGEGSPRA